MLLQHTQKSSALISNQAQSHAKQVSGHSLLCWKSDRGSERLRPENRGETPCRSRARRAWRKLREPARVGRFAPGKRHRPIRCDRHPRLLSRTDPILVPVYLVILPIFTLVSGSTQGFRPYTLSAHLLPDKLRLSQAGNRYVVDIRQAGRRC